MRALRLFAAAMQRLPSHSLVLVAALTALSCPAQGAPADTAVYLAPVVAELEHAWPRNRTVNLVCHGHSVPAGYFRTPAVETFNAYPSLLHRALNERFPFAVLNVIVTAIGGENSVQGAARFERDVLSHRPDVVCIDYALNDRRPGLAPARAAWVSMIEKAQAAGVKILLLTPTPDTKALLDDPNDPLNLHAGQIRQLASEYETGLVDSLARFQAAKQNGTRFEDLMAQFNHPNARGHELVAAALLAWFPASRAGAQVAARPADATFANSIVRQSADPHLKSARKSCFRCHTARASPNGGKTTEGV